MKLFPKIVFVVFIVFANTAFSAPSVKNVSIKDGKLFIEGTGFGSKSNAAPLLWEDFESGSAGMLITAKNPFVDATKTGWKKYAAARNGGASYTTSKAYSGKFSAHNEMIGSANSFNTSNYFFKESSRVYHSYWIQWTSDNINVSGTILKYGRICGGGNTYNGPGTFLFSSGSARTGNGSGFAAQGNDDFVSGVTKYYSLGSGKWHKVEMYVDSVKGLYWASVDGMIITEHDEPDDSPLLFGANGFPYNNVILGLMCANIPNDGLSTVRMWVDDVYVDNTPARVEIGNSKDYNKVGTIRENQIPTVWEVDGTSGTGKIEIPLMNWNAEKSGELYVFVYDSDGARSPAYAFNPWGTDSSSTQPSSSVTSPPLPVGDVQVGIGICKNGKYYLVDDKGNETLLESDEPCRALPLLAD